MSEEEKKLSRKDKKEKKKAEKLKKKREVRLFPANKKGKHKMRVMDLLRIMFYPIHSIVYPFKLYGNKKVGKGAYVYVGNHYCLWDIFYPAHTTWEGIHFLAKQSILEAPIVGRWARGCGVIGAQRDGSDVRTVMDAMRVLKNGEKISIFPEGTRNKVSDEEFLPFHGGAAMFAIKTKTPVIPFAICNRPKVFRKTHVVFGEPMEFTEYYGKKLTAADYEEAEEKLKNAIYTLREEHRAFLREKKRKRK
ncbi:MAG: 1-acyl-sn-glycerol-3-phosphate acyltransferase [Clostridia bacterium]|jgi:1-acyl-sn-glycerol-3-phosphate acyltransferase|nr:1-acyl-sn-glycerol-3-phosphate acyltransferase [Clostridia bacterium]